MSTALLDRHPTLRAFLSPRNDLIPLPAGVRHCEVWPEISHPCFMIEVSDRSHIAMAPGRSKSALIIISTSVYLHQHLSQIIYAVVSMNPD